MINTERKKKLWGSQKNKHCTYIDHTSTSGPYFSVGSNNSGAAYSRDPHLVFISSSLLYVLLRPKSIERKKTFLIIKIMFNIIYCAASWWLLWFKFELSPFDHKLPDQLTNIIKYFDIIIKLPHDILSQRKFTRANIDYFLNMCYNKLDAATQIRSIPPWQQLIGFSAGLSINSTVLPQMEFFW